MRSTPSPPAVQDRADLQRAAIHFASLYRRHADQHDPTLQSGFIELEAEYYPGYSEKAFSWRSVLTDIAFGPRRIPALARSLASTTDHLSLVEGAPGCGKSVILRKVARDICSQAVETGRAPVAIYLDLKKLSRPQSSAIDGALIAGFAAAQCSVITGRGNPFIDSFNQSVIDPPACLFLFDSFDEVPEVLSAEDDSETVELYFQAIHSFIASRENSRAILATRYFRRPKQSARPTYRVAPLSLRQSESLIAKSRQIPVIQRRLYDFISPIGGSIAFIAQNPLYLHLLIQYASSNQSPPSGSYQLFAGFIQTTLEENAPALRERFRCQPRSLHDFAELASFHITADASLGLNPNRKDLLLATGRLPGDESAHDMLDALEFLHLARGESTGDASPHERAFTFSHRRFQEYFATSHVKNRPAVISAQQLLREPRWRETAVVLLRSADAESVARMLSVAQEILDEAIGALRQSGAYVRFEHFSTPRPNPVARIFPWPPNALQLLSLLQEGFAENPSGLPKEIRAAAGAIIQSAFCYGRLEDRRLAIEVSGTLFDEELTPILRLALASGSQLLDDAVFHQVGRLSHSPDLSKWVRLALLNRAFSRQMFSQKRTLLAFLARINDDGRLYRSAFLLFQIDRIDVAIHFLAAIVVIAVPGLDIDLRFRSLGFLGVSILRPAFSYFARALFSRGARETPAFPVSRDFALSEIDRPLFVIGTIFLFRVGVPAMNIDSHMPYFFDWMIAAWFIAGSWAPAAALAALEGEWTAPKFWPLLPFFPIRAVGLISRHLLQELTRQLRVYRRRVAVFVAWLGLATVAIAVVVLTLFLRRAKFHLLWPHIHLPAWFLQAEDVLLKVFYVAIGLLFAAIFCRVPVELFRYLRNWLHDINAYRRAQLTDGNISATDFLSELGDYRSHPIRLRFIRLVAGRGLIKPTPESLSIVQNFNLMLERESSQAGGSDSVDTGSSQVDSFRITCRALLKAKSPWLPIFLDELTKLEQHLREDQPPERTNQNMKDFFISYNSADKAWAKWIAAALEQAGHSVIIEARDFLPGQNFVLEMHQALLSTRATLIVLSQNYLDGVFTHPEWAATFATDPKGAKRLLIPIKVGECSPGGLLGAMIHVNLIGLNEQDAKAALLGAFQSDRSIAAAPYPAGSASPAQPSTDLIFPGNPTQASIIDKVAASRQSHDTGSTPQAIHPRDRIALMRELNALPSELFNMLLFAIRPGDGLISPMPAPQAERATQLLRWAESSVGCGLPEVIDVLSQIKAKP